MEDGKEAFLPNETIHNYFYQLGQHGDFSDFCTAATGLTGRFGHFMAKSPQVTLHEAFTHKTGVFRSNLVKASQTKSKGLTRESTTTR